MFLKEDPITAILHYLAATTHTPFCNSKYANSVTCKYGKHSLNTGVKTLKNWLLSGNFTPMWTESGNAHGCSIHGFSGEKIPLTGTGHKTFHAN